jgi:hypothetical protein
MIINDHMPWRQASHDDPRPSRRREALELLQSIDKPYFISTPFPGSRGGEADDTATRSFFVDNDEALVTHGAVPNNPAFAFLP